MSHATLVVSLGSNFIGIMTISLTTSKPISHSLSLSLYVDGNNVLGLALIGCVLGSMIFYGNGLNLCGKLGWVWDDIDLVG